MEMRPGQSCNIQCVLYNTYCCEHAEKLSSLEQLPSHDVDRLEDVKTMRSWSSIVFEHTLLNCTVAVDDMDTEKSMYHVTACNLSSCYFSSF